MEEPIMPSLELIQRLREKAPHGIRDAGVTRELCLIADAYIAGADQELEACCAEVPWFTADKLRAARRPKPPSLKEQALGAMGRFTNNAHMTADEMNRDFDTIRRALEELPND